VTEREWRIREEKINTVKAKVEANQNNVAKAEAKVEAKVEAKA
jgi:hypothetical protein